MGEQKAIVPNRFFAPDSLPMGSFASRFLNRFERLFHNLRMKNRSGVKWHKPPGVFPLRRSGGYLSFAATESLQLPAPSPPRVQSTEEV